MATTIDSLWLGQIHARMKRVRVCFLLLGLFLAVGCVSQTVPSVPPPTVVATTAITTDPAPATEHRIGVRIVNGAGEFFDRLSGERFVPRGVNLIRLS
ncbi:MAG: hypothetical protein ACRDWA_18730, partial [Acidimicrobiia bacterium]